MIIEISIYLCRKSTEEPKPEVAESESEIFIKEVAEELAHSEVGPSAVHQEQTLQIPKLSQREVTR